MNRNKAGNIILYIVIIILAVVMGFRLGNYVFDDDFLKGYLIMILILIFSIIVQTFIHEAGHLVFGLISGYRFLSFRIMSLMWVKDDSGMHFKRYMIPGTLGQCLMAPPPYSDAFPVTLYNLGGALMNIITAVIFYVLYFTVNGRIVRGLFLTLGYYGLISAIMNGVPLKTRMLNNDGMNLVETLGDQDSRMAFFQQLRINELITKGVRTRDMDPRLFYYAEPKVASSSLIAAVKIMNEARLIDIGDYQGAYALVNDLLSGNAVLGGYYRYVLQNEKEYLDCMFNRYVPSNDPGYQKFVKQMEKKSISFIRTRIAIAKTTGDLKSINGLLKRFEKLARRHPFVGEIEGERELVRLVTG